MNPAPDVLRETFSVVAFRVSSVDEISVVVNKASWMKLNDEQRKIISDAAAELEADFAKVEAKENADELEKQAKAGVQVIEFKGDEGKAYLDKAYAAGWEGIIKQSPVHGPKLREFFSK